MRVTMLPNARDTFPRDQSRSYREQKKKKKRQDKVKICCEILRNLCDYEVQGNVEVQGNGYHVICFEK